MIDDANSLLLVQARTELVNSLKRLDRVEDGIFRMLLTLETREYTVQALSYAIDHLTKCKDTLLRVTLLGQSG